MYHEDCTCEICEQHRRALTFQNYFDTMETTSRIAKYNRSGVMLRIDPEPWTAWVIDGWVIHENERLGPAQGGFV
jgi:hypothetical protein